MDRARDYLRRRRMDYARRRRNYSRRRDSSYGVGHYIYEQPTAPYYAPYDHRQGGGYDHRQGGMYDNRQGSSYDSRRDMMYDHTYYGPDHGGDEMYEYEKDLKEWIKKLKHKDRFNLPEHEVIQKAHSMSADFNKYTETEFYAVYLMMISDHPKVSTDPHMYLVMAKDFFDDDDIATSPSEKLCKYLYEIVLDV